MFRVVARVLTDLSPLDHLLVYVARDPHKNLSAPAPAALQVQQTDRVF